MADPQPQPGTIRDGGLGQVIANNGSGANTAQQPVAAVDLYGNLAVMTEGTKPTFSAVSIGLAPAASGTDIWQITAGAKTVRLTLLTITGIAGTAVNAVMNLYWRPTASTAGTAATGNALPSAASHDSVFNPAATATLTAWTANPTVTSTGAKLIRSDYLLLPVSAGTAVAGNPRVCWDFTSRNGQGLVLRPGFSACVHANAATISSGLLNISAEWTEE